MRPRVRELMDSLKKTNLGTEAVDMFKGLDRDGSKTIDFSEYLRVYYRYANADELKARPATAS